MAEVPERVLIIAGTLTFRGSSILTLRLARGLQEHGTEVVLLCTGIGHIDERLRSGLTLHVLPGLARPVWGRIVRRSVLKNLQERPPDVIHLASAALLPQAAWLGNQVGCPVVLSVHDHAEAAQLSIPPWAACCRTIVAVSDSVQAALPGSDHLNHVEQRVILPGVPVCPPDESQPILSEGRDPVIGMAGPLEVLKGGSFFLRACHRIVSGGRDIRIVIAGSGPEERNLRKLANSLQLADRVTFVDDSTDMQTFLSAMDVFCLPSLQQGIGVLLLEAMALGRPVVASGVGGIVSVLNDTQVGITVPASDSRRLADAVTSLLASPEKTRQMANAGRDLVARQFGLSRMVQEMHGVYSELLGGDPAPVSVSGTSGHPEQETS